jgi:hypothetical protein
LTWRQRPGRLQRLAIAVFLAAAGGRSGGAASSAPPDVASYLRDVAGFAPDRLAALEAGEAIVKTASDKEGELSVVGAVRIRTTKEHVKLYFDKYIKFEDGVVVLRVGRFANPPTLQDVARLQLEPGDIEALRSCRPGDCEVQVGAGLAELQAAIDWRVPDHAERVNAFVRQRLVDYVKAYRERGDAALVTYVGAKEPLSLARAWQSLLAKAPHLHEYAPELRRYLEDYPRASLPGGSDFIQWAKVDQGLKPVIALTHVILYRDAGKPDRISVASKQIYASRFSEGAFSLATVVDATPQGGQALSYVVLVNRTRTDVLRGKLGGMKRKLSGGEIQKGVALTLRQMQEGLEKAAGVR